MHSASAVPSLWFLRPRPAGPGAWLLIYGAAIGLPALTLLLRLATWDLLPGYPFVAFFPSVAVVALLGGPIAGGVAAAVSALLAIGVLEGLPEPAPRDRRLWVGLLFYAVACATLVALASRAARATALALEAMAEQAAAREGVLRARLEVSEAAAARSDSERRLEQVTDALPVLISQVGPDLCYRFVNRAHEEWFGRSRAELVGRHLEEVVGPELLAVARPRIDEVLSGRPVSFDTRLRHADGQPRDVRAHYVPNLDPEGEVEGYFALVQDVTERTQADRQRELLVRELNHRVKNMLAVVQSIAAKTFGDPALAPASRRAFEGRLMALAAAHDLLTSQSWESASLRALVWATLQPFAVEDRLEIAGPDLRVRPQAAVSLALALHELATNAAKYGALSSGTGRVAVAWSVGEGEAPTFRMSWRESGGPRVEPPARTGFGSRLIRQGLAGELGGPVALDFAPEGLTCALEAPLANLEARRTEARAGSG